MIIDWAYVGLWIIKELFGSLDFVPVIFVSSWNDQLIVVELMSFISDKEVFGGVDFDDSFLGPMALIWNDLFHSFETDFWVNHIETYHGPSGLIIMVLSWLKDSDVCWSDVTSQEMWCCVETSCTTADDTIFSVMVIEDEQSFPDEHYVFWL